jgi:hypothetical protein
MSYAPNLGRWMQQDPLGYPDGPNSYEYLGSGPTAAVDPLGLTLMESSPLSVTSDDIRQGLAADDWKRREEMTGRVSTLDPRDVDYLLQGEVCRQDRDEEVVSRLRQALLVSKERYIDRVIDRLFEEPVDEDRIRQRERELEKHLALAREDACRDPDNPSIDEELARAELSAIARERQRREEERRRAIGEEAGR